MSTLVEFIGLCVFTTQVVSPTINNANLPAVRRFIGQPAEVRRVVAIMPRVPDRFVDPKKDFRNTPINANVLAARSYVTERYALGIASEAPASATATKPAPTPAPNNITLAGLVEAHTAMLMFRPAECFDPSACTDAPVQSLGTGWSYVELRNGEQVAFVTDAPNVPLAGIPELGLHLTKAPLGRYAAPPYEGAAAVFTMPVGVLSACSRSNGRVDTGLTLETQAKLKITFGTKTLTMRDGAIVIAANVPFGYADHPHAYTTTGANHSAVYCAMQGNAGCGLHRSTITTQINDGYNKRIIPDPEIVAILDWSCSNSQWP